MHNTSCNHTHRGLVFKPTILHIQITAVIHGCISDQDVTVTGYLDMVDTKQAYQWLRRVAYLLRLSHALIAPVKLSCMRLAIDEAGMPLKWGNNTQMMYSRERENYKLWTTFTLHLIQILGIWHDSLHIYTNNETDQIPTSWMHH